MEGIKAKFIKKNGEEREMRFIKISNLPEDFLKEQVKGTGSKIRVLQEGSELVWDLDKKSFRVFNWNSIIGEALKFSVNESEIL
ncbi:hypothetical protein M0R19_04115 [Candidatus Pacearchaeota archaeon]|jgi:hypothetical protein|nr:hypothetical protein [Candidatus Pacearchaeota archaeon]